MTPEESGRKGGLATRDNHISLCPCCGNPIRSSFFEKTGQKGGEATLNKYGREHFVKAGRMGGRGNKRNGRGGDYSLSAGRIS